jgi:hypothetical protein
MTKVRLKEVRGMVRDRSEFVCGHMYAHWQESASGVQLYCVLSWGIHLPILIWSDKGGWYKTVIPPSPKRWIRRARWHLAAADPQVPAKLLAVEEMRELMFSGEPPPPEPIRRLLSCSPEP